jgi:predicted alpha-1,6-mannanase (GH76 family)
MKHLCEYGIHSIFILLLLFSNCSDDNGDKPVVVPETPVNWALAADSSSKALVNVFWNVAGDYFNDGSNGSNTGFGYWPQAHALDVLTDAYVRTGDIFYKNYFDKWYEGVGKKNGNSFFNEFYDDMEWNALAMLRVYNATSDAKFLSACRDVWTDIQTGWNTQGHGGIAWKKDQLYSKNACSNGPAAILAARLYRQFNDNTDKEWALKIYRWEKDYLFNPANGAVFDNLNANTGEVNTSWIFTYNQGTFLGAALELFEITGEKSYMNDAIKTANYTLSSLVNASDQVLKSEGAGDGGLFKGIFIRYFTQLILSDGLDESTRKRYIHFLKHNGTVLWNEGTDKQQVLFGTYWKTKPSNGRTGLSEQLSGCMLMEALALLQKENKL